MSILPGFGRLIPAGALLSLGLLFTPAPASAADIEFGVVAHKVARLLEDEHYSDHQIDDEISRELFDNYLEFLDPGRLYFLKADIDFFTKRYQTALDDGLLNGDITAAFNIYAIYEKRLVERVEKIKKLVNEEEFTFDSDRSVQLSRKDMPWPATEAEADQLWHNIIEGELLQEELRKEARLKAEAEGKIDADEEEEAPKEPKEIVVKRYERILDSLRDNTAEDIAGLFLKALSNAYDPHTDYFTQSEYDNFQISMAKSLTGIGALLSMNESGYAEIRGLVVGGPAHKGGELQVNDRIVAVGEGNSTMEDIMHMKLQKVVDLIRGTKGSTVRLKVIPVDALDPSETRIISIKRDEVDLKESLARAELIETKNSAGKPMRVGWIDLPSFYADMRRGETSVTRDVKALLSRLMKEGIEGVVLDLRLNGGGSLEEAINLTGLFIPSGPVVQSKDSRDVREVKSSSTKEAFYKGPLVVLTSRQSASASEILAAALQDYDRAIIVGEESTFGKGTVQQLLPVHTNNISLLLNPNASQAGALKLTIQKFYRIAGGSTQNIGVKPDIILPSITDAMEIGEASLKNPLPFDQIDKARFAPYQATPMPIAELRDRSKQRVAVSPDFEWIREETARYTERKRVNKISLNREERIAEVDEQEAISEAHRDELKKRYAIMKEREKGRFTTYSITLDRVDNPKLKLFSDVTSEELTGMMTGLPKGEDDEEQKALEPPHGMGPVKREAISILLDFIDQDRRSKPIAVTSANGEQVVN